MQSTLALVPAVEVQVIKTCGAADSATEIRTRNTRMILPNTVFEKAASRHVAVEPSVILLTANALLILNVLHNSFERELVSQGDGQALGQQLLLDYSVHEF